MLVIVVVVFALCWLTHFSFSMFFKLKNTCVEFHKLDLVSDQLVFSSAMLPQR